MWYFICHNELNSLLTVVEDFWSGLVHVFCSGATVFLPNLTRKQTGRIIVTVLQNTFAVTSVIKQQRWTLFFLWSVLKSFASADSAPVIYLYLSGWKNHQFLLQASEFEERVIQNAVNPKESDRMPWCLFHHLKPAHLLTWIVQLATVGPRRLWSVLQFPDSAHSSIFLMAGACWSSLRSPESPQLLLGGWRLHLQVFRGDSGRSLPQSHQAQPRHPMDHKACAQAQRDARPDICRKEEPWPGQGPQVPPDHRRLPSRCLEEAQHPAAAPLPLGRAPCLYIQKINILFMVTAVCFFTIYIWWYF